MSRHEPGTFPWWLESTPEGQAAFRRMLAETADAEPPEPTGLTYAELRAELRGLEERR